MQNKDELKSSPIDVSFGRASSEDESLAEDQKAREGLFLVHDKTLSMASFVLEAGDVEGKGKPLEDRFIYLENIYATYARTGHLPGDQ